MRKILFPTDFSETANNAFVYALQMADKMKAEIVTLHTYTIPDVGATAGFTMPATLQAFYESIDINEFENYKEALPSLRKIAEEHQLGHIEMKHALVNGTTVATIIKVANEEKADMIVMGTDGARGLKEIFIGTNTAEVMENANCPVLAVPAKAKYDGKIDRIAVTTDYTEEEKKALERAIEFADYFDATVDCINVDLEHTHQYLNQMDKLEEEYADNENVTFSVLEGIDLEKTILRYLDEQNIDILVMLTHKRNFIEELFHLSIAKQLVYHSHTPIMSIQAHTL